MFFSLKEDCKGSSESIHVKMPHCWKSHVAADQTMRSVAPDFALHCIKWTLGLYGLKVSNGAKIRNRYNQVPHLTQDTNGKVTNSQKTPQTRAKRSALSQQVTKKHI